MYVPEEVPNFPTDLSISRIHDWNPALRTSAGARPARFL
jgi:hypothetical protein